MVYTIVNKFIPESKYKLKAPHVMDPQYITIHNTANDATALNEIAYMTRNDNATSYHVAVDDIHAVQAIPFNRNAWHCGDGQGNGNRKSIGVEICYSKSGGDKYKKAEENAIEYVAHVLKQKGWGIDRVKWHRDWSGKNCPHRIFAEGRAQSVKDRIVAKLKELDSPSKPVASTPPKKEDTIMSDTFKPTSHAIDKAIQDVLYRQARRDDNAISDDWRKKYVSGELSVSDAIGLLFVMVDRGQIPEK